MKHNDRVISIIFLLFTVWASVFIFRTSIIGIDGNRYYALHDDAMISMRYAQNFSDGNGLVWNPGERVEGYTNFLWTIVMSIFTVLFDKKFAVLAVQLLGILIVILIAFITLKISIFINRSDYQNEHTTTIEVILLIGILGFYPLVFWSLMGMETGLQTLLILCSVYFAFLSVHSQSAKSIPLIGLFLGLAYLTRPDSMIFAALIFLYLLYAARNKDRSQEWTKQIIIAFIILTAIFAGLQIFRWHYYGSLVPNTYALKVEGFPIGARLMNGIAYIVPFFKEISLILVLASIGLIMDFRAERVLGYSLFLVAIAFQVWVGGDAWRNWRMLVPAIPFIIVIAILEAERIASAFIGSISHESWKTYLHRNPIWESTFPSPKLSIQKTVRITLALFGLFIVLISLVADLIGISDVGFGDEQRIMLLVGLGMILISALLPKIHIERTSYSRLASTIILISLLSTGLLSANKRFFPEMTFTKRPFGYDWNKENIDRSIAINQTLSQDASIGVAAAGIIPYYTGRYAVDFLGKMDPLIADLPADISGGVAIGSMITWPGHNKYNLEYSIGDLQPTYVQLMHWGDQNLSYLIGDLYCEAEYQGVRMFLLISSDQVLWSNPDLGIIE